MRVRRVLLPVAVALLALPRLSPAQVVEWVASRPFPFRGNFDYLRSAAAPTPTGDTWWTAPQTHSSAGASQTVVFGRVMLARLSPTGAPLLQRTIGGSVAVKHLTVTPDNGVCLTGVFADSVVFDAQTRLVAPSADAENYFIARLDAGGRPLWVRALRNGDINQGGIPISGITQAAFDRQGGVWVGYENFTDSYLTHYDATTGDSLRTYRQQDVRRVTSLALAPDGTLYAAGSCLGRAPVFNGQAVATNNDYNTYVACYEPGGRVRWVRHVRDITCAEPQVATADTTGVYFASNLFGAVSFGAIQANGPVWSGDFFLTRLDRATGTFQWVAETPQVGTGTVGPASQHSLTVDAAGNAWFVGNQAGRIPWTAGLTTDIGPVGSTYGAVVLAYDRTGAVRAAFSSHDGNVQAHGLTIDAATNQGILTGLAVTGTASIGTWSLPTAGTGTVHSLAIRFDATLTPLGLPATSVALTSRSPIPNPVAAGGRLTFPALPTGPVTATLVDAVGRVVSQAPMTNAGLELPAGLPPGLYGVRLSSPAGTATHRVVVE